MVAIVGASGSGKSTLMNILGCLDRPTSGTYAIAGQETANLDADALSALRREHLGFIFQRYHLLGELSALGNVEIPAIYAGNPRLDAKQCCEAVKPPRYGRATGSSPGPTLRRAATARFHRPCLDE